MFESFQKCEVWVRIDTNPLGPNKSSHVDAETMVLALSYKITHLEPLKQPDTNCHELCALLASHSILLSLPTGIPRRNLPGSYRGKDISSYHLASPNDGFATCLRHQSVNRILVGFCPDPLDPFP